MTGIGARTWPAARLPLRAGWEPAEAGAQFQNTSTCYRIWLRMKTYPEIVRWLYSLEAAKGMDFKLERVALALERLGSPHLRYPCFHIAGTNGKGSVAAMLHAVLMAAGYRVGLYTSPHLVRFTERIRIGNAEIEESEVAALALEIQRDVTSHGIELTFFEFVTVMAFLCFARARIDVAVVEVGLGGRLDATNVVDPLVSVITTIGRDHADYLGHTVGQVAAEKGGIIKSQRAVVLGRVAGTAAKVISAIADERRAPLVRAERDYTMSEDEEPEFDGFGWRFEKLRLSLRGRFQRENAGTALAALALTQRDLPVSEPAIREGLGSVFWPGRLEIIRDAPLIILDGAHNVDGISQLTQELPPLIRGRRVHLMFAVMADKSWRPMVDRLAPYCSSAVVTEVLPPRGLPPHRAARRLRLHCPTEVVSEPARAWDASLARTSPSDVLLATGSLFLIGAIYPLCRRAVPHALPEIPV